MDNGFIFKKINKNVNVKERKRSWGPFRIYQLISTANPALILNMKPLSIECPNLTCIINQS